MNTKRVGAVVAILGFIVFTLTMATYWRSLARGQTFTECTVRNVEGILDLTRATYIYEFNCSFTTKPVTPWCLSASRWSGSGPFLATLKTEEECEDDTLMALKDSKLPPFSKCESCVMRVMQRQMLYTLLVACASILVIAAGVYFC
jgi:hypothetical protein